jgi:site-specific DNA-methyltransferase (adenine-specific)
MNTYECLLWATKGRLCIKGPLPDVLYSQKVGVVNRDHAAEKPVEFLMQLIGISTEVGDAILDPCAGSGSVSDAALRMKRLSTGIELDEIYYNRAMTRLHHLSEAIASDKRLVQV